MTIAWRLLKLARPHWQWMLLGTLLAIITTLANISLLAISGWFLAAMAAAGLAGVTMNYFTPAGVIRFLALVRTAGRYAERLVTHNATLKLLSELRVWFYQHLEPLAPTHLQHYQSGDLLSRVQSDIDHLDNFYLRVLLPVLVAVFVLPLLAYFLLKYDLLVTLLTIFSWLLIGLVLPYFFAKQQTQLGGEIVKTSGQLRTHIIDGMQGIRELRLFQAQDKHLEQAQTQNEALQRQQLKHNRISSYSTASQLFIINLVIWIMLWWLIPQVQQEQRVPTDLALLVLFVLSSFEAVIPIALAFSYWGEIKTSATRLFSIIDQPPTRPDPQNPASPPKSSDIEFKQVEFMYQDKQPVLRQLNLTIKQGEHIAIVGASGAGKSSLAQLLLGYYQAQSGTITLGKTPINQLSGEQLRDQITLVNQHPHLFAATIRDNLLIAKPDTTENELFEACEIAGLADWIHSLPNGLDTWLGETGYGLSGGQARRLSIAQAILHDTPIMILDEPTEGLDPITEKAVMQSLLTHLQHKTVILITHRPNLLQSMDCVFVLKEGQISAFGKHEKLLKNNRDYTNLLQYF